MSNINEAIKEVKTLILEAQLKDIFSHVKYGDEMLVRLKAQPDANHKYYVNGKDGDVISLTDADNKTNFLLKRDSINNEKITVYKKDSDAKTTFEFIDIAFNLGGKQLVRIDNESYDADTDKNKELESSILDMQDTIKKLNSNILNLQTGNLLMLSLQEPEEGEPFGSPNFKTENYLTFTVSNTFKNYIFLKLSEIDDSSTNGNYFYQNLSGGNEISLNKDNFIKIEKGLVVIDTVVANDSGKPKPFKFKGVIDAHVNTDVDDESGTMTKKEISSIIRNDKHIQNIVHKQPGVLRTIMGASPKGLYTLSKLLQKAKLGGMTLTKNTKLYFNLLSPTIMGSMNHKLHKSKKIRGLMMNDKTIKVNDINKPHWEIELLEEVEDNFYKVKVQFCDGKGNCENKGKASIEVIEII